MITLGLLPDDYSANGNMDGDTSAAVFEFQRKANYEQNAGLEETGDLDQNTLKWLLKYEL